MDDRGREAEEARRSLASMSRETGLLGGARMREDEGEAPDAVEIWAKRVGRALGVIFVVILVINLFTGWFFEKEAQMDWTLAKAPAVEDFQALADAAYAGLPEEFRALCEGLVIHIDDFPDEE